MITVTKTFLPPQHEYNAQVARAWQNGWLTNRGELVLELEDKLKKYLNTNNILATNNGTTPLQIALQLLAKNGEVITTPFSYVATTAAIMWQGCTPVFVDIDEKYLTIDETKIEAAITPKTTCILATHVFGNPCNIEVIESIAAKHNLAVIYDAAHSFGVQYNGKSIFEYGTVSTCSFHATKLFHTGEGGAIFSNDKELQHKIYYSHNFGHNGTLDFYGLGINGKMSELQAAMGLSILPHLPNILASRKIACDTYNALLNKNKLVSLNLRNNTEWNYSHYPIFFENEEILLQVEKALNNNNIFPRRYFYPSLNSINYTNGKPMPISESIAKRVLCLPLFASMLMEEIERIAKIVNSNI